MFDQISRKLHSKSDNSSLRQGSPLLSTPDSVRRTRSVRSIQSPSPRNEPDTSSGSGLVISHNSLRNAGPKRVSSAIPPPVENEKGSGLLRKPSLRHATSATAASGTPLLGTAKSSDANSVSQISSSPKAPSIIASEGPHAPLGSIRQEGSVNGEETTEYEFDLDDDDEGHSIASHQNGVKYDLSKLYHTSVMLVEAGSDTPAFRASVEYLDLQFKSLEQWLVDLALKSANVVKELSRVKDSVNQLIKIFMPSATHSSILAHDYTTLLFGRYAERESSFWTDLLSRVTRGSADIDLMVKQLHEKSFAKYNDARREYLQALKEQDDSFSALTRMPDHSEPAALRDVSFASYKARRKYLKAATNLVISISDLETETTISLLETLGKQFIENPSGYETLDTSYVEASTEFYRMTSVAASLRAALPGLRSELKNIRMRVLKEFRTDRPALSLKNYYEQDLPVVENHPAEKAGWVNVEVKPGVWNLLWAYLKNDLFGFLGNSENRTVVVESRRFAVHACQFQHVESDDRRCLFRIKSGNDSVLIQAPHKLDLARWRAAFEASAAIFGTPLPENPHNDLSRTASNSDLSLRELLPWNRSFAIPGLFDAIAPGSEAVVARIREVKHEMNLPHWLRYDSTLTTQAAAPMAITVPSVKPMPTSVPVESIVANSYFKPFGVPNAITSNIWGCLGGCLSLEDRTASREIAHYDGRFPRYPSNYPRALVLQDMDMRSVISFLPDEEKVDQEDFLLFLLRATMKIKDSEVPIRLYVTSKKLVIYSSWSGLVHLQSFDIANILEIENKHHVEYSELRIALQDSEVENSSINWLHFRLYIDSSQLAKQQLDYVWKNRRSRDPKTCHDLLEPLTLMYLELAYKTRNDELYSDAQQSHSGAESPTTNDDAVVSNSKTNDLNQTGSTGRQSVVSWLTRRPSGKQDIGDSEFMGTGKGMRFKLLEDTFPISARALFIAIFGPQSTVFGGHHSGLIDSDNEVGPWYRKAKRTERKITQNIHLGSAQSYNKRYNYQRIDRQDHDIFVVTERLSAWELPRGDQFFTVMRYVVYNAEQGSNLQIWGRVVWQKRVGGAEAEETVRSFSKLAAQGLAMRIRQAASKVQSAEDALKLYGRVKATKLLSHHSHESNEDIPVIRLSVRTMAMIFAKSPFLLIYKRVRFWTAELFYRCWTLSGPVAFFALLLVLSLFGNYKLLERSRSNYWSAHIENLEITKYMDALKLSENQSARVFTRAIYLQDIEDMIKEGSMWPPANLNNSLSSENENETVVHGCNSKFNELAQLSSQDVGGLYEFEPHVQDALNAVSSVRLDYAIRRNELMTMIRVLNLREREALEEQYRNWLILETNMCSRVRPTLQMLNSSVLSEIKQYCINCLEEAKLFL